MERTMGAYTAISACSGSWANQPVVLRRQLSAARYRHLPRLGFLRTIYRCWESSSGLQASRSPRGRRLRVLRVLRRPSMRPEMATQRTWSQNRPCSHLGERVHMAESKGLRL
jgi:hypothetical protein